jgi:hypothetical protein
LKSLQELGAQDRVLRLNDFAKYARLLAVNRGNVGNAVDMARQEGVHQAVVELLQRSPVTAGGAGGAGDAWGEQTTAQRLVLSAFASALAHRSIFARMASDRAIVAVPLGTNVGFIASSSRTATTVTPGGAVPLTMMNAAARSVTRQKAAAACALTLEFMRENAGAAEQIIVRLLRDDVAAAIDAAVVPVLMAGAAERTATASMLDDLSTLLIDIGVNGNSRLYAAAGPFMASYLATLGTNEVRTFPNVGPMGGELLPGVPLVVSDGVGNWTLMLIDASKITGALEAPELSTSTNALLEMDDSPAAHAGAGSPVGPVGPSGALVSLFQENAIALMITQFFGVALLRSGASAAVSIAGSP